MLNRKIGWSLRDESIPEGEVRRSAWRSHEEASSGRTSFPSNEFGSCDRRIGWSKSSASIREGLGLIELGSFEGHAGYSGVFLGLPDLSYHLEFTRHEQGSPCPAPSKDNLLVLYFEDAEAVERTAARLDELGHPSVRADTPYWETVEDSVTVEDPDGWRVVLVKPANGAG